MLIFIAKSTFLIFILFYSWLSNIQETPNWSRSMAKRLAPGCLCKGHKDFPALAQYRVDFLRFFGGLQVKCQISASHGFGAGYVRPPDRGAANFDDRV